MPCSFPPSSFSSNGGDGEEEKVPGGSHQQPTGAPLSSSPPSVVLRLKAYPNVSLHTDDVRRAAVMTLLPATIPTLADAVTIQHQPPDDVVPTRAKGDTEGEGEEGEEGGDPPPDVVEVAAVFPCLLLRERELAQFLLYLQEILQEIRALPLLPD